MVDQTKRTTLKRVAGVGVGAIAATASNGVLSRLSTSIGGDVSADALQAGSVTGDIIDIQVTTRISPIKNDLEVVLTNISPEPTTITQLTPTQITTGRGLFDFDALLKNGKLHLPAGASVSVPMQHHAVVLDGSTISRRTFQLSEALRKNMSIVTDGDSLAALTILDGTLVS